MLGPTSSMLGPASSMLGPASSMLGPTSSTAAPGSRRIFAAVNPSSGGNRGRDVLEQLTATLGVEAVFDLEREKATNGSLAAQIAQWDAAATAAVGVGTGTETGGKRALPPPALLVCGGDGTVSWLLSALVECGLIQRFAVATIPLGTANDWARVMGWSNSYFAGITTDALERLQGRKEQVLERQFDVWGLQRYVAAGGMTEEAAAAAEPIPFKVFGQDVATLPVLNYFSVGFDAKVAQQFGAAREDGHCCTGGRMKNMCCYMGLGCANSWLSCGRGAPNLRRLGMQLLLDGVEVALPCCTVQVTVINIPSYANGAKPWDGNGSFCCTPFGRGAVDDGRAEVFALFGPQHMAALGTRQVAAHRIGHAQKVEMVLDHAVCTRHKSGAARLYFQYDGEAQHFTVGALLVAPLPTGRLALDLRLHVCSGSHEIVRSSPMMMAAWGR